MHSIWDEQTLKPDEIVLVEDGPLSDKLHLSIERWQNKLGSILKSVPLEKNVGLGKALNIGLEKCSFDIVARMDTDDIAVPERFDEQIRFLEDHPKIDLVGSWVGEFENSEDEIISVRKVPQTHEEITEFAKKRNPINHPSVVYRKQAVLNAGNYQHITGFEDYYLWVRMLMNGNKMANIPKSLLKMRAGFHILERRGGLEYIKNEIIYQQRLKEIGFIDYPLYLQNITTRTVVRMMPSTLRGAVYKMIRKSGDSES